MNTFLMTLIGGLGIVTGESVFKGKIVDKITGSAVPFCHISTIDGTEGVYSDYEGNFEIHIEKEELLIISCVGYVNDTVELSKFGTDQEIIFLEPAKQILNEIVVKSTKYKKSKIGFFKKKFVGGYDVVLPFDNSLDLKSNYQLSTQIDLENYEEEIYKDGIIKALNFLGNTSLDSMKIALRIKFFRLREGVKTNNELILDQNIYLFSNISTLKKNHVINIDLEKYAIPIPKDGLKVVVEFLGLYDKNMKRVSGYFYLETSNKVTSDPKSFLVSRKTMKGQFVRNKKGLYFNIGCWLDIYH